jgi:hypothetical protein
LSLLAIVRVLNAALHWHDRHYFCERCALRHNAKSKTCFVCETATGGIFNVAHDIKRKLKADKRKAAEGGD